MIDSLFTDFSAISIENIPDLVLAILERIEKAGFFAFIVGGCIRDLLCKKTVKDWDIVTDADPGQIQNIFHEYKTVYIGKKFQTVTLIIKNQKYHISEVRYEKSEKKKSFLKRGDRYSILVEDLLCRDFTINSIAWNHFKGILDSSDGLTDLKCKVIRSIDPDGSFQKDPLRMIRAVRFTSELNFFIDLPTEYSILRNNVLINKVSPERIKEELCLILKSSNAKKGILLLKKYGLEKQIFNVDKIKKVYNQRDENKDYLILHKINNFKESIPSQLALWGRLTFASYYNTQLFFISIISSLKFDKKTVNKTKVLLSRKWEEMGFDSDIDIRRHIQELGKDNTRELFQLKKTMLLSGKNSMEMKTIAKEEILLENEVKQDRPVSLKKLAINGADLIKAGIPEGRKIGEILRLILNRVVLFPENNEREYLMKIIKQFAVDPDMPARLVKW